MIQKLQQNKFSKCGNVNPFLVPAPKLDVAKKYGFKIDVKITGNSKGGRGMKRITGQNEIIPNRDFPIIRLYLEKDALKNGDTYGGLPHMNDNRFKKKKKK